MMRIWRWPTGHSPGNVPSNAVAVHILDVRYPGAHEPNRSVPEIEGSPDLSLRFTKLASDSLELGAVVDDLQGREGPTVCAESGTMQRILLAEDDDSMRGFLERALVKAGYDVQAFSNGVEALDRLKREPFTLLLTDIVMPRMDGIELARHAVEFDPELKVMFITGFAAVTLNTDTAPKNAHVLSKPFHLRDLVSEVDKLLAA